MRRDRHERDDTDLAPGTPVVEVQRLGGADRRTVGLVGLVVAVLALVIAKPWGDAPPAGSRTAAALPQSPAAGAPTASPRAPGSTSHPDGQEIPCWSSQEWRAVTVERRERQTVISWMAVDPVSASGPDDARIPLLRVVADDVLAIGFCDPVGTRVPFDTVPQAMTVWHRTADGPASSVGALRPAAPLARDAAAVFQPGSGTWRPGTYTVQVLATAARTREGRPLRGRWFGFEIVGRQTDASPTPRPTASPSPGPGSKRVTCPTSPEWSLVTLQLDGNAQLQTAHSTEALPGPAEPDDARLVPERLADGPVAALGFCPPSLDAGGRPLDVTGARFWRRQQHGAALRLDVGGRLGSVSGERDPWLYGPPSRDSGFRYVLWPDGTYVVAVEAIDTDSFWLALTLGSLD